MKNFIGLLTFLILLTGCFSTTLIVEPIPCDKFIDSKKNIEKVYMSQRPDRAPASIEVTDEAIFLTKDESIYHNITGETTVHTKKTAIYFNKIEKLRVVDDNTKRTEIRFYYPASDMTHIVFLYDKDLAIEGYSAIKCMIEKAKKRNDGMY